MKSFFKRSAISVVVLGMAGSVYAAAPSTYNANTWAPQFSGAFIGVEGLDLRPMNGDLDYVTVNPVNLSAPNGTFSNDAIHTSYDWSWRVFGGLKFTENDDLTVSWMQMRTSDNDSVSPTGTALNGAGDSTPRWLFNDPWISVNGHVTFDLDDAYAVWGHTINFNNPWSVRFAGGVEYARLRSNLTVTADSGVPTGLGVVGFKSENETKGIGPRVEMDLTYHLPYGFALFGNANGALLVATRDISLNVTNTEQTDTNFANSDYSDRHVVIPKLGMRLGASYTYVWGEVGAEGVPCRTTSLTVDAGWQVESYIHAIERPEDSFEVFDTGFAPNATSSGFASTKTSNFSDQGLFVGVKLGTDWM